MINENKPETKLEENEKNNFLELIKNNWIKEIKIKIQEEKTDLLIITHIIYKIDFTLDDEKNSKFTIFRRYNDFKFFRMALNEYLPCLIIYSLKSTNANRRLSLKKGDELKMRKKRLKTLNYFFDFLKENKEKARIEPFMMFFNPEEKETEIGNKLKNLKKEDLNILLDRYNKFYPNLKNLEEKKLKEQLVNFKNSIEVNIEFFYVF